MTHRESYYYEPPNRHILLERTDSYIFSVGRGEYRTGTDVRFVEVEVLWGVKQEMNPR